VCEAILHTVKQKLLNAYYYPTELRAKLAKLLIDITPPSLNKVLFLSTGSEATEAAFKMTRLYGAKIHPKKTIVVSYEASFHGKTMGSQMLGGKPVQKQWMKYQHPEIVHLPYPYPWLLDELKMTGEEFFYHSLSLLGKKINLKDIAGFFVEPYQGWCVAFFPKDYLQALRKWSLDNKSILGFDEVQSGFGRTGKMFGFENFDIVPDLIWCAKAISSSLPVSAVIGRKEIIDGDLSLNSTHGGNPLGMAASLAAINVLIDKNIVAESYRKGLLVENLLSKWHDKRPDIVAEVFGKGMVWGIMIRDPITKELDIDCADKLIEKAMQKGVLSIRSRHGTIKIAPPLTIPDDALSEAIDVLICCLEELLEESIKTSKSH
jgi:4-aminobutyrate aminotransferase / (S)-3-amino-2-methylpropionate transaminase / 5-aminovalerate transaminase